MFVLVARECTIQITRGKLKVLDFLALGDVRSNLKLLCKHFISMFLLKCLVVNNIGKLVAIVRFQSPRVNEMNGAVGIIQLFLQTVAYKRKYCFGSHTVHVFNMFFTCR